MLRPVFAHILVVLVVSVACGGSAPEPRASPAEEQQSDAVFTESDLDGFERGLKKEVEAIKAAREQATTATDPQERGRALEAQFETATIPQGAERSGLGEPRYRDVRQAVIEVLRTLDFQGKIDGPLSMDMTRASEATKARLARDPYADLPPSSAEALRARLDRLVPVWIAYVNLTAVAG
jgi:hypothetical protein